jgi:hypothetical protein
MLFVVLGAVAVIFGFMGIIFAITGVKDNLKKYVGTENRGLAAVLGIVGVVVGSAIILFFL